MPFGENTTQKSSLVRSRSFGGLLNSKSLSTPPMLGQSFKSPQMPKKSVASSFSRKTKVPKVPRPQRALLVFEHVKKGIGECINATDKDIENMRASEELSTSSTGQAKVIGIEKQIKAAERYKKKLEFHLSKIEELEDHYKLHQQLREGVKTMAKAYASQMDSPKKSSLFNVKAGYKECTQVMCAVEAQLENMMGTFHCQMQGLIGFARMVPGDVYEVVIRHGHQKWKCKGRIGLTQQTWDSDAFSFKALVGDVFNIKASELRSLSSVTLGHKNCEIKDLFSSHPQLMTVSLNVNGSIKLNLVVTWNPLDGVDDSYSPFSSVSARVSVPKRRVQSMYVMGTDTLSELGSNLSSPDQSLHRPSPRRHVVPETNFKLASFMSPIATNRNYALPDHSTPCGPSARPKSIAVMGTIDELGLSLGNNSIQNRQDLELLRRQQQLQRDHLRFDENMDLKRDLTNYMPKSLGNQGPMSYSAMSKSERDLRVYTHDRPIDSQFSLYPSAQFSPIEDHSVYSPQPFGSQPRLTTVASANLPHYAIQTQSHSPYSPRPFSYTQNNQARPNSFDMSDLSDSLNASRGYNTSAKSVHSNERSLEELMNSIKFVLEDFQGHYTELRGFEEQVHYLDRLLKKNSSPHSPKSEDGGISIEDALNAFDFLETEDYIDGYAGSTTSKNQSSSFDQLEAKCTSLSPESTAKTSDSGIECLASRLNEDHGHNVHEIVSTGNMQVDRSLIWHLTYCEKLLQRLGHFSPMKCKEFSALEKLQRQADIIEHLVKTAKKFPLHIKDLQSVMSGVTRDKQVKKLWVLCTDSDVLFTSVDKFLTQMDKTYSDFVKHKSDISPSLVFRTLLSRILDLPNVDPKVYCPDTLVTMHQVFSYLNKQEKSDMNEILQRLSGELWIMRGLKSGNTELILKTLATLKSTLPPPECLKSVAVLLTSERSEVRSAAATYLQSISGKTGLRRQAVMILLETLEEQSTDMRGGACVALKLLKGRESLEQLTYLCQNDSSIIVQQRAKEALLSFGEEGRLAFHDSQLTSHGFQGVTMHF